MVEAIKADHRTADVPPQDRAILDYTDKLTRTPAAMVEQDIIALRNAGFTDKAILEINLIAGFFAWCNRLVDGLGVELEPFWAEGKSNV